MFIAIQKILYHLSYKNNIYLYKLQKISLLLVTFAVDTKNDYICSMKNQTTYSYQVATQNVDFTLRATIESLGNYILNTAGIDAQGKGFGVDALAPQNLTWVLSKFVIEIDSRFYYFDNDDYGAIIFNLSNEDTKVFKAGVLVDYEIAIKLNTDNLDNFAALGGKDSIIIEPQHPIEVRDSLYSHLEEN